MNHDPRCDSGLCHPDCPLRKEAAVRDRPYPGSPRRIPMEEMAAAIDAGEPASSVAARYRGVTEEVLGRKQAAVQREQAKKALSYARDAAVRHILDHPGCLQGECPIRQAMTDACVTIQGLTRRPAT